MAAKHVTSQDVADEAGVSRTTVSLVLNNVQGIQISEETRQKVVEAAKKLKYVPNAAARALVSKRAQIVAFLLTRSPHHIASDAFLTQVLNGLINVLREHDMRLLVDIVEPEHQKEAYLDLVRAKRIDGVLLSGPRLDDEALHALEEDGFPTVLIGNLPGSNFCSVDVDNRAAAYKATDYLIRLGHKRIACLTNAQPHYTAAIERLQGYHHALEVAGMLYDERLVRFGDFGLESGYSQMKNLLDEEDSFTAAFVASDIVALGAKAALWERGLRVPDEIALIGFDDLPIAIYSTPPLTTIHLPALEIAQKAAEMLFQLMKGKQPSERQVILDTHLVVRESCGAKMQGREK